MKEELVKDLLNLFNELTKIQFSSTCFLKGQNNLLLLLFLRNTMQQINVHKHEQSMMPTGWYHLMFFSILFLARYSLRKDFEFGASSCVSFPTIFYLIEFVNCRKCKIGKVGSNGNTQPCNSID